MRFSIEGSNFYIDHNDKRVEFSLSIYDNKTYRRSADTLFREVNLYLESIPEKEADWLFKRYVEYKDMFDTVWDVKELKLEATDLTTKLLDFLDYEEIRAFVVTAILNKKIVIPFVNKLLAPEEREDLSYIESDYVSLIAYGIMMRFMFPIWDTYMNLVKPQSDNLYKEYYAFSLCMESKINNATDDDFKSPILKLRRFICFQLEPELRNTKMTTFNGLGSSEIYDLILSLVIVRKLSLTVLGGCTYDEEPPSSVIAQIHTFIGLIPTTINREVNGTVKPLKSDMYEDEGNDSVLDKLRSRENIAPGNIKLEELGCMDIHQSVRSILPDTKDEVINQFISAMKNNTEFTKNKSQFTLVQTVMDLIMSSAVLELVQLEYYKNAVVITQVIMHEMGYHELALLINGNLKMEEIPLINGNYLKIHKELLTELYTVYPCFKGDAKLPEEKRKYNDKITQEIEEIVNGFINCSIHVFIPMLDEYQHFSSPLITPLNIRIRIAEYLCDLNRLSI